MVVDGIDRRNQDHIQPQTRLGLKIRTSQL